MTRDDAISRAQGFFDSGTVRQALARRVAMPTESQNPQQASVLVGYLDDELRPAFEALGFTCHIAKGGGWPFLLAERMEDANRPTVLGYGHGDVVRGVADQWAEGLSPWVLTDRADRWYGRRCRQQRSAFDQHCRVTGGA